LTSAELAVIAELGVPVIFDEVYQQLGLAGDDVPSAIQHSNRHLIVNSFSKSLSLAGYRVGYLISPESETGRVVDVKATTSFSTCSISQTVVEKLLPHWVHLISIHRSFLRKRWQQFATAAQECGLTLLGSPAGGLYGLLDVSECGRSSASIAMELAREYAVAVDPGDDFGSPDPGYLRLNFAGPSQTIEPGLQRIADCLSS